MFDDDDDILIIKQIGFYLPNKLKEYCSLNLEEICFSRFVIKKNQKKN